jgi:hypothetical protein
MIDDDDDDCDPGLSEREVRMACLHLAVTANDGDNPSAVLLQAAKFAAFVLEGGPPDVVTAPAVLSANETFHEYNERRRAERA